MSGLPSLRRYWDTAAAAFDDEADHGLRDPAVRGAWATQLARWLPGPPAKVLDLGCGTGSLSRLAYDTGHDVVGVDLSPRMIDAATAKCPGAVFVVGDAGDPPVRGTAFDAVLCRHLLWTLADPQGALARWTRLLGPGGRLVLVEGRWSAPDGPKPYAVGADEMPWFGGVGADELQEALRPLVDVVHVHPLSGEDALWGGPVDDERYAVVAWRRPPTSPVRRTEHISP